MENSCTCSKTHEEYRKESQRLYVASRVLSTREFIRETYSRVKDFSADNFMNEKTHRNTDVSKESKISRD